MNRIHYLSIQWHITTNCLNRCLHCYMYDKSTYAAERANQIGLTGLLQILDSITVFEQNREALVDGFIISGGDPLLHPQWFPFLKELRLRGKTVYVMGNPETLTEDNTARLAELGIKKFQVSLDGLGDVHDAFRSSPGSFQRTLRALERLNAWGIPSQIMFTLFPRNKDQLIPLFTFVATQTPADYFSFDLGVCAGNAASLEGVFSKEGIKEILSSYVVEKDRLRDKGYPIRAAEKNNLLKLVRFQQGEFYPFSTPEVPAAGGCLAGWTALCILSDGTVLPCRRLPIKIGKIPGQSFEQIFLSSGVLKKFRRPQFFNECGACPFFQHCRGCPAVANGQTGNPRQANPLCFYDSLKKERLTGNQLCQAVPLDTSPDEEYALIARHFANRYAENFQDFFLHPGIRELLFWLMMSREEQRLFFTAPDSYLVKRQIELTNWHKLFVQRFLQHFPPEAKETELLYHKMFLSFLNRDRVNFHGVF